jgi:hypothetical protein
MEDMHIRAIALLDRLHISHPPASRRCSGGRQRDNVQYDNMFAHVEFELLVTINASQCIPQ